MLQAEDIMKVIKRCVAPLKNKISMIVGRCAILAINDAEGIQKLKIAALAGETLDNLEHFQSYGLTSYAPDESEGVAVFPMGNREHGIVVAMDNRKFRLKNLAKGEVALYTDEGDKIHFKRGGIIEMIAASEINATVPTFAVVGNLTVDGNIEATGDISAGGNVSADGDVSDASGSMQDIRDTYNTHTHNETNTPGGSTLPPNQQL